MLSPAAARPRQHPFPSWREGHPHAAPECPSVNAPLCSEPTPSVAPPLVPATSSAHLERPPAATTPPTAHSQHNSNSCSLTWTLSVCSESSGGSPSRVGQTPQPHHTPKALRDWPHHSSFAISPPHNAPVTHWAPVSHLVVDRGTCCSLRAFVLTLPLPGMLLPPGICVAPSLTSFRSSSGGYASSEAFHERPSKTAPLTCLIPLPHFVSLFFRIALTVT